MGILRSDRVSGLGGANAINGSVVFRANSWLNVEPHDDLTVGSGDFTIECWINVESLITYASIFSYRPKSTNGVYLDLHYNSGWSLYVNSSYVISGGGASGTSTLNTWAHLALCKSGSSTKLFVDGAQVGSTYSDSNTYLAATEGIAFGALGYNRNANEPFPGHISNFRIIKGEALYTSAFTVPAQRLTKTANTVLLCFQSPGDVLKEETGKTITVKQTTTATSVPKASRFAPDIGEDYGTTFEDNTKFDTLSYMVPAGGATTQRGRGRAVYAGGYKTPSAVTNIDYLSIQSGGFTETFGNLSSTALGCNAACSSETRMIAGGGWTGSANNNAIEYITIATTSNSTDFGDLAVGRRNFNAASNGTRGLFYGGNGTPADSTQVDYVTVATTGNAADFGDASQVMLASPFATASNTRALFGGGYAPGGSVVNTIEYFTIASTGNYTNFGDLTSIRQSTGGLNSSTRSVFGGGGYPTAVNTIDYVTTATTGNASDFGDLSLARGLMGSTSNGTRGVFMGGTTNPARQMTVDSITIASKGDAANWGDLRLERQNGGAASDSHGGLS